MLIARLFYLQCPCNIFLRATEIVGTQIHICSWGWHSIRITLSSMLQMIWAYIVLGCLFLGYYLKHFLCRHYSSSDVETSPTWIAGWQRRLPTSYKLRRLPQWIVPKVGAPPLSRTPKGFRARAATSLAFTRQKHAQSLPPNQNGTQAPANRHVVTLPVECTPRTIHCGSRRNL